MKSCVGIYLIAVVYLGQLKKIQADMRDPAMAVPTIETPVGPDREEGPTCQTCCQGGPAAVPAVQGTPGHEGPQGLPGLPGERGDIGLQGFKGDLGADGMPGVTGELGSAGKPGTGPRGQRGPKGDSGFTGPKGSAGDYGPRGFARKGLPGFSGFPGIKGQQGDPGFSGPDGKRGDDYPVVFFTLRRKAPFSSTSDTTRLSFDEVMTASPDTAMIDLDTGMFTCPRRGTYVFMFSVLKSTDTEQPMRIHLHRNEEDIVSAQSTSPENYHPVASSATLDLRRGDMVFLTLYGSVRNVTDSAEEFGAEYTSFSGFLI